jgi:NAD(P)-dependent dehydrogenase (short-subunit alcohol dehydrogenase family)
MARAIYELRGRTVLITGAAGGIGSETARQQVTRGANVSLLDVDDERLEEVAKNWATRLGGSGRRYQPPAKAALYIKGASSYRAPVGAGHK